MIIYIGTHGSFRAFCRENGISPYDTRKIRCVREPRQLRSTLLREEDEVVWGPNPTRTPEWQAEMEHEIELARMAGMMSL